MKRHAPIVGKSTTPIPPSIAVNTPRNMARKITVKLPARPIVKGLAPNAENGNDRILASKTAVPKMPQKSAETVGEVLRQNDLQTSTTVEKSTEGKTVPNNQLLKPKLKLPIFARKPSPVAVKSNVVPTQTLQGQSNVRETPFQSETPSKPPESAPEKTQGDASEKHGEILHENTSQNLGLRASEKDGESPQIAVDSNSPNEGTRADQKSAQSTIETPDSKPTETPSQLVKPDSSQSTHRLTSEKAKEMRKKRTFYPKSTPVLRCDSCAFSAQCPAFKASYECAFGNQLNLIKISSLNDVQEFKTALLEADLQRVQFGLITERINGGNIDPNVSQRLDAAYAKLNAHIQSQNQALQKPVDTVQLSGPSLFSTLFGAFSKTPPKEKPVVEILPTPPIPTPPMVVEEVNSTKRSDVSELISKLG